MDDTLPALEKVLRSKLTFDLIWVSAVWMHVPRSVRARAFRKLVSVMSPGASMMFSLRQGPPPLDRPMEPATAAEAEELARRHGLQTIRRERISDAAGRTEVSWDVVWLRLPDDGTGALPLLRHIRIQRPEIVDVQARPVENAGSYCRRCGRLRPHRQLTSGTWTCRSGW